MYSLTLCIAFSPHILKSRDMEDGAYRVFSMSSHLPYIPNLSNILDSGLFRRI